MDSAIAKTTLKLGKETHPLESIKIARFDEI